MNIWIDLWELFFPKCCVVCGERLARSEEYLCFKCLSALPRSNNQVNKEMGKGLWGINYVNSYDFFVGPDWVDMLGAETDVQFFGTHAWGDITTIDWSTLPPEEYIDKETKNIYNSLGYLMKHLTIFLEDFNHV